MNAQRMELVQSTPPVQTPLVLLYAPAMKDLGRIAVCALVRLLCQLCKHSFKMLTSDTYSLKI